MRILVTGTAGFIGFHLAISLLDEGHEVVGYEPMTSIREGIPRFVDWYCDYHQIDRRKESRLVHELHEVQVGG
jgi:nucleoside-diphosphate-sugar epimerase